MAEYKGTLVRNGLIAVVLSIVIVGSVFYGSQLELASNQVQGNSSTSSRSSSFSQTSTSSISSITKSSASLVSQSTSVFSKSKQVDLSPLMINAIIPAGGWTNVWAYDQYNGYTYSYGNGIVTAVAGTRVVKNITIDSGCCNGIDSYSNLVFAWNNSAGFYPCGRVSCETNLTTTIYVINGSTNSLQSVFNYKGWNVYSTRGIVSYGKTMYVDAWTTCGIGCATPDGNESIEIMSLQTGSVISHIGGKVSAGKQFGGNLFLDSTHNYIFTETGDVISTVSNSVAANDTVLQTGSAVLDQNQSILYVSVQSGIYAYNYSRNLQQPALIGSNSSILQFGNDIVSGLTFDTKNGNVYIVTWYVASGKDYTRIYAFNLSTNSSSVVDEPVSGITPGDVLFGLSYNPAYNIFYSFSESNVPYALSVS